MTGPAGSPAWEASGGAAYESLISDQLAEERKRKESLEQRAAFALTSGGGFVTLTLGIAALVTRAQDFALPENARTLLLAAVVAFGLSAAAAIAANVPFRYLEVDEADIRASVETYWDGSRLWAEQAVSLALIDVLEAARKGNGTKAIFVVLALLTEASALGLIAAAAWVVLA